jgi:hypothetical protein
MSLLTNTLTALPVIVHRAAAGNSTDGIGRRVIGLSGYGRLASACD